MIRPLFNNKNSLQYSSIDEFYRNAKMSIVDYPFYATLPLPSVHNAVYIGGRCKRNIDSLTIDASTRSFIEDPVSKGTIVIAFGHGIKWEIAPAKVILFKC